LNTRIFFPAGDRPRPAQHEPVGVGRGRRHLPERQLEALGQQLADNGGVGARQHGGQAALGLAAHHLGDRLGRMAEHGAGIAQAEVVVGVAVDIDQRGAVGLAHEQRKGRAPIEHPMHGHAAKPVARRFFRQLLGRRIALREQVALAPLHGRDRAGRDTCY
jgi:hypothetical protein